jgi:Flp pilus assembly protein TadB
VAEGRMRFMATSVYKINKGINKPIEFKGLKAQYIAYLAAGLISLLILFAVLYIIGVNMFVCLALIVILGTVLFMSVYRMSDKYGQYGLLKKLAIRSIPDSIKATTRKVFTDLAKQN